MSISSQHKQQLLLIIQDFINDKKLALNNNNYLLNGLYCLTATHLSFSEQISLQEYGFWNEFFEDIRSFIQCNIPYEEHHKVVKQSLQSTEIKQIVRNSEAPPEELGYFVKRVINNNIKILEENTKFTKITISANPYKLDFFQNDKNTLSAYIDYNVSFNELSNLYDKDKEALIFLTQPKNLKLIPSYNITFEKMIEIYYKTGADKFHIEIIKMEYDHTTDSDDQSGLNDNATEDKLPDTFTSQYISFELANKILILPIKPTLEQSKEQPRDDWELTGFSKEQYQDY